MLAFKIVSTVFWIYSMMLIVRILSSWFEEVRDSAFIRFLSIFTDPYLNFFRSFIPPIGMLDISPIVAFFALSFLENLVLRVLF